MQELATLHRIGDADSAAGLLALQARLRPEAVAIAESPQRAALGLGAPLRLSFHDVDRRVAELAGLFVELGLKAGETVAVQLPHIAEQMLIVLGAWRAGLRVSVLPLLWRRSEIATAFGIMPPRIIVTAGRIGDHDHALVMRDLAAESKSVRHILGVGEPLPDGVAALDPLFDGEPFAPPLGEIISTDIRDSLTIWTATAQADAAPVAHSQTGLVALGRFCADVLRLKAENHLLNPYPATGLPGIGIGLMAWLVSGATLMPHPPFDYGSFLSQIDEGGATHLVAPSAVLDALSADGLLGGRARLEAIACMWPGPRTSYPDLSTRNMAAPLFDVHNLAQLGLSIRRRRPGDNPARLPLGRVSEDAAGPCAVETRVRGSVRNGGDRHALVGELFLRGAAITPQDEASLAFVNTRIACAVDGEAPGFLRCERDLRVIHHGGVAICAFELDALYAAFPGVLDAAAFSLPDRVLGERLFAAVVPRPESAPSLDMFARHLAMREVAPYKIPDQLVTVKKIPRSADGAVLRDAIPDCI